MDKWCSSVGCYLRPGVHDVDEAAVVVGLADGLQQALVLQAAGAEAGQWLTAPAHGRLALTDMISGGPRCFVCVREKKLQDLVV